MSNEKQEVIGVVEIFILSDNIVEVKTPFSEDDTNELFKVLSNSKSELINVTEEIEIEVEYEQNEQKEV